MNNNPFVPVPFHGANHLLTEVNGKPYIAMRPLTDALNMNWDSQWRRIKRHAVLSSTIAMMATVGADGRTRKMVCLPLEYLNGWLFGIDVNRVKPEAKEALTIYQRECFQALNDYWFNGCAIRKNKTNPDWRLARDDGKQQRRSLTDAGKAFAEYRIAGGSSMTSNRCYQDLTKMTYQVLGLIGWKDKVPDHFRDQLPATTLSWLSMAEQVVANALDQGMAESWPYKQIREYAKNQLQSYVRLLPKQNQMIGGAV